MEAKQIDYTFPATVQQIYVSTRASLFSQMTVDSGERWDKAKPMIYRTRARIAIKLGVTIRCTQREFDDSQ